MMKLVFSRTQVQDQLRSLAMALKLAEDIDVRVSKMGLDVEHDERYWNIYLGSHVPIVTVLLFSYDLLLVSIRPRNYVAHEFYKTLRDMQEFEDYIPELYKILSEKKKTKP